MNGQMSIFDFPEYLPEESQINDYPCGDCRYDKNGCCGYNTKNDYCVLGDKKELKAPAEIWAEETGISDYWQHDIEFKNDKPVCKHSGHSCNRKELWEIAKSLDNPFCPRVCCRKCAMELCGARCNGSEEPKKARQVIVKGLMDDGYCPSCDGCMEDLVAECQYCGQKLLWDDWRRLNE